MWEAKCINIDCPAAQVWILHVDIGDVCITCGHALSDRQEAPEQKMADPEAALEEEPFEVQA